MLVALVMIFHMNSKLNDLKEKWERVQDKLSQINSGLDKLGTAVDWFLGREGLKLEYMHATWKWYVTSLDDKCSIYRSIKAMDREQREAMAKALYEASIQAMRDFANEQKKEAKKK